MLHVLYQTSLVLVLLAFSTLCSAAPEAKSAENHSAKTNNAADAEKNLNTRAAWHDRGIIEIAEDSYSEEELLRKVLSRLDSNTELPSQESAEHRLSRRAIFGRDNRVSVDTSLEAQTYPYSTVVSLSSGCTGTLIGIQHVLTAAHCVHDGKKYLKQSRNLKIGMLQRSGKFRWIKVRRIFFPKAWKKLSKLRRRKHDYAVLELRRPHSRPTMSVQASALHRGSPMQFAGFHSDKWFNSMWKSYCQVVAVIRGAVLNFCDAEKGISGSGVYVRSGSGIKNAVVGVVSAVGKGRLRGKQHMFNVAISMDARKVRHINKWMRRLKPRRRS